MALFDCMGIDSVDDRPTLCRRRSNTKRGEALRLLGTYRYSQEVNESPAEINIGGLPKLLSGDHRLGTAVLNIPTLRREWDLVDGTYPPALRKSGDRVRLIALTPPGVSTMEGIRAVIDDLVRSSTTGVETVSADGEIIVVYTDIVGYVADYQETGHALDILGQNGNGPSHLCAFLKFTGHRAVESKYVYSTEIHSSDTCYAHMWERTDCLRRTRTTDEEPVGVGLNKSEQAVRKNSPLVEIASEIKAASDCSTIPLTIAGSPVVNPRFDPYRSVLVSPDHVLFGVSTNALNFAFSVLPSNTWRKQADGMICRAIRLNGRGTEANVYNPRTSTVHAASISIRYATLLVAPAIFLEVMENYRAKLLHNTNVYRPIEASLQNLTRLRRLVAATYWFPDVKAEGMEAVRKFNGNCGGQRLAKLERICEDYVRGINDICREFPDISTELDKPNVHRVLELYKHSISSMGHVRHFAELLFKTAHQQLKRAIQKSNFRESHLQSSWTSIVDDWRRLLESVMSSDDGEDGTGFKEKEF